MHLLYLQNHISIVVVGLLGVLLQFELFRVMSYFCSPLNSLLVIKSSQSHGDQKRELE